MNRKIAGLMILSFAATAALSACGKDHDDGAAQKTTGNVESAVGSVTGDQSLKREGKKDQVTGDVKQTIGDVKDAVAGSSK